jgi:hypothetical protein
VHTFPRIIGPDLAPFSDDSLASGAKRARGLGFAKVGPDGFADPPFNEPKPDMGTGHVTSPPAQTSVRSTKSNENPHETRTIAELDEFESFRWT